MSRTSFIKALHEEAPGLISVLADVNDETPRTPVSFKVDPVANHVRLSIKLGDSKPRVLLFATETDAAKFLGLTYKSIKFQESAFSLLLR